MRLRPKFPFRRVAQQTAWAAGAMLALALARSDAQAQIDVANWGSITAPVFGTSEAGLYAGAELFAGPNKFGSYYAGVLPNGRIVRPAGTSIQIGMNPLGAALTSDGKYLITSNDDERDGGFPSLQSALNMGGYSLSVVDTQTMTVVSQINSGPLFVGLQITGNGPYTIWASGGADTLSRIKLYTLSSTGVISSADSISVPPLQPKNEGYVNNYTPDIALNTPVSYPPPFPPGPFLPPLPSGFGSRTSSTQFSFPSGSTLSPDGRYLYVACNGDNTLAVIDTATRTVVAQIPVGYFPYDVAVSQDGSKILVSNWGMTEYKFAHPTYDPVTGNLTAVGATGAPFGMIGSNLPDGFYIPVTDTIGKTPKTSSISLVSAPGGAGAQAAGLGAIYMGQPLDALYQVGDTHPSAMAIVRRGTTEVLYVSKSNSDSLGLLLLNNNRRLADFDLAPVDITIRPGQKLHGSYPNALAVSPDNTRVYVAEAGLNSVAVLDTSDPIHPKLLGRIPTGWYPTGVRISPDGNTLYILNAKGIGEDVNPRTTDNPNATGVESFTDGNYIFGSLQKVDLASLSLDNSTALGYNYALHPPADTSVVPVGGTTGSSKIKHVFFILKENKTFDSELGNQAALGPFASVRFNNQDGTAFTDGQYTGLVPNMQLLATAFATGVNYYSDSEESDAGHQFSASGTATDYTEKTLLVKTGRGLLVNKNFEPEDYPEAGYIFNNAARNGVSFKDYGAMIRIQGTDTGTSVPSMLNDPLSGLVGYPAITRVTPDPYTNPFYTSVPLNNLGDVSSPTQGLGQSYFMKLPILAVLGTNNPNGEPRLDTNYPGYNFNISDQRRAIEFCHDFDRMQSAGTLPTFFYIYLPNDHTGSVQAPNAGMVGNSGFQQIADGDVGLGMIIEHIMRSPIYYNNADGTGSAIFITPDDAQSSNDHIHPHRTPLVVISPYARPGYLAKRHYVTASIVKTEELLMGLPPNNLGDLLATDLRDLFQPTYNGITADALAFNRVCRYTPSPEGQKIWQLVSKLDTSSPDSDSRRLGRLNRLSGQADQLHRQAENAHQLQSKAYLDAQTRLYSLAQELVEHPPVGRDDD